MTSDRQLNARRTYDVGVAVFGVKGFAPLSDAPVARNRDQHLVAAAVEGGRGRSAGGGWVAGPTVPSTFLGLLAHPQTRVGLVPLSDAAVARHRDQHLVLGPGFEF